jgi:hypothetical protein
MRPKERAAWRRAIASAPAFARQVIAEVDGGLTVHRRACDDEESSCAQYDESGAYSVSIAPIDFRETFANLRFVTLHELGHIVDYIGLDAAAYGDTPLADPDDFEAVLREHWGFRPPLWRNPAVR